VTKKNNETFPPQIDSANTRAFNEQYRGEHKNPFWRTEAYRLNKGMEMMPDREDEMERCQDLAHHRVEDCYGYKYDKNPCTPVNLEEEKNDA